MTINNHLETFADKQVIDWDETSSFSPATHAPRIALSYEAAEEGTTWPALFARFLATPAAAKTSALVIGNWSEDFGGGDSIPVVSTLVAKRAELPALTSLFFGDIIVEECEISWIKQSNINPVFAAYPNLREFVVRGGDGLSLGQVWHEKLESLTIQTGGLDQSVVLQVLAAQLPALTHLELWLGDPGYGATTEVEDLSPLMQGKLFPKLRYLGLKNSHLSDQIAIAYANAPILQRLETFDLSMGTLGDDGAKALAGSKAVAKLKHLNISHHYCTDEVVELLMSKIASLDAGEQEEPGAPEDDRYVSVSE